MSDIYKKIVKNNLIDDDILSPDAPPSGFISTGVIILNLAFSGRINGGIPIGRYLVNSAHTTLGKSIIGMSAIREAQKKNIYCIVLDAEYAWDWELAKNIGIDCTPEKLLVYQNNQIEDVQAKIMNIVDGFSKEERKEIFFMLDSWGALVTREGVKKANDVDSKKDMTEIVKKNRLANMIVNARASMYITNSVYDNVMGFGDPLKISGGKRLLYNSQTTILGRSKAKEETKIKGEDVLTGAIVTCKVWKSRLSREQKSFSFRIKYNGGLDIFYGILEDAITGGYVKEATAGYFSRPSVKEDKKWREKDIYCSKFWSPLFTDTDLPKYLESVWRYEGMFDVATSDFKMEEEIKKEEETPTTKV